MAEISDSDYKQIDKIFYSYIVIALVSILVVFFLRTYLNTKAHTIIATE